MNAKRIIAVMLMLLLTMLTLGCDCDSGGRSELYSKPYTESPDQLVGTYVLPMKVSETNAIGVEHEYHDGIRRQMDISLKDQNTLTAKFGNSGKPFDLAYDRATGTAKGTDDDGFKWEIRFNREMQVYTDKDGHTTKKEPIIVMESVTRERKAPLGLKSVKMTGSSESGLPYRGRAWKD